MLGKFTPDHLNADLTFLASWSDNLFPFFSINHFVLSTNFLFKFNVSLPLVTGELLQNTVDVNNVNLILLIM